MTVFSACLWSLQNRIGLVAITMSLFFYNSVSFIMFLSVLPSIFCHPNKSLQMTAPSKSLLGFLEVSFGLKRFSLTTETDQIHDSLYNCLFVPVYTTHEGQFGCVCPISTSHCRSLLLLDLEQNVDPGTSPGHGWISRWLLRWKVQNKI